MEYENEGRESESPLPDLRVTGECSAKNTGDRGLDGERGGEEGGLDRTRPDKNRGREPLTSEAEDIPAWARVLRWIKKVIYKLQTKRLTE